MLLTMGCRRAGVRSSAVKRIRPQNYVSAGNEALSHCWLKRLRTHIRDGDQDFECPMRHLLAA